MAELASIPARVDQWSFMEAEINTRWSQLAYLDGPGYTICDRMEAKWDLQQHYLSRSSFHGVENSIQKTQTEPCSPHLISSMADLNQQHNSRMAESAREIQESCARILKLLQEEIDASESLAVDVAESDTEQIATNKFSSSEALHEAFPNEDASNSEKKTTLDVAHKRQGSSIIPNPRVFNLVVVPSQFDILLSDPPDLVHIPPPPLAPPWLHHSVYLEPLDSPTLSKEIDVTDSMNDAFLTSDETLLSMEPIEKYSISNEESDRVEVITETAVSPFRNIAKSLYELNSKNFNPCFCGTKASLPVRSNATHGWRNKPYDPGPLVFGKFAAFDSFLASVTGIIMIPILGASQTCEHRIRKTTESTSSTGTLIDAYLVFDEMDFSRNWNFSLVSIDNCIEIVVLRTETASHVSGSTMFPCFLTAHLSLIVVLLYTTTLEYQVIGVLRLHNGVHSCVEFKFSLLHQFGILYTLKALLRGVLSFGIFKYEDHLDRTQVAYASVVTLHSHALWYLAIDMYATLKLQGLVITCGYEFNCVLDIPSRLPALKLPDLIYCAVAIPLPPPKPPDRSGCTVVPAAAPKLPIEFSVINGIWSIVEYCIMKGIDKVLMHEYSYIEALIQGLHLLSGYACSIRIIIHAINSVLISITNALILCGRLSCSDVVARSSLIDGGSTFDHCWMAHVDTSLSILRSALLPQLTSYSQNLILECIEVENDQQLKVSLRPFDTNERTSISQANLHVLPKMDILKVFYKTSSKIPVNSNLKTILWNASTFDANIPTHVFFLMMIIAELFGLISKEFMEVKSLVSTDWEQMVVEMLDKFETNLICLTDTTVENRLQNRVSSCFSRLAHIGIQPGLLTETKSFDAIDVKSAIGIVHHMETRLLIVGISRSFAIVDTKYMVMSFGTTDCSNFSLRDFFFLSFGSSQQWDPGGQLDVSITARTYQFKHWDPG